MKNNEYIYNFLNILFRMSSFNCLIITILLIITYITFTYNFPQYENNNIYCKPNNVIRFISLINHINFIIGNIYLLFLRTTFEEYKKIVIRCVILQITYLWISIFILNNAKCTPYLHLTNYYSFINSAFWMSAYGLYIKLVITQLFV